jgi:hypothetical protein
MLLYWLCILELRYCYIWDMEDIFLLYWDWEMFMDYMCMFRCYVMWHDLYACMYCGLFEDVASISRIWLYIRAFYRLLEIGCYSVDVQDWVHLRRREHRGLAWCFLIFLLLLESSYRLWLGLSSEVFIFVICSTMLWIWSFIWCILRLSYVVETLRIFGKFVIIPLRNFLWKSN